MQKENRTTYIILGFLNHEDMTGYELKKRIDLTLGHFWVSSFGQIYPTLHQLVEQDMVIARSEVTEQHREKISYSITEKGKQSLKHWVSQPVANEVVKYEILLKLFFGSVIDAGKNRNTISDFKDRYVQKSLELDNFEHQLKMVLDDDPNHLYYLLTVLFGKKVYQAYSEWADEAMQLLNDVAGKED